jgi:hypothetical protein
MAGTPRVTGQDSGDTGLGQRTSETHLTTEQQIRAAGADAVAELVLADEQIDHIAALLGTSRPYDEESAA